MALDSPKLRKLSRAHLQSLAKREAVRAIGKTEDIIRRLLKKHPKGVPVPELDHSNTGNPGSASSAPSQRIILKIPRKGTPSVLLVPRTPHGRKDPKGKSKQVVTPSPSSSTEDLELLYPENCDDHVAGTNHEGATIPRPEIRVPLDDPAFLSREVFPKTQAHNEDQDKNEDVRDASSPSETSNPGWRAEEEEEDQDDVYGDVDYPKGAPTHYMVVDALRQFTTLVNTIPSMETRVAEGRCLLHRTETQLEKAIPDARELAVTREYLETFLLGKMKQKRELWDGTANMAKRDRKVRMEWLKAERRAENERRWRETNELYEKKGLQPEPFEAFASQSDEEVIESLETTPSSSRSGSAKRTRDESVNGDTDEDIDTDGERLRKRARA